MVNQPSSVSAVTAWGFNIVSSVGIIMANKQVMSGYGFVFATSLSALHFVVTSAVGAISSALGYSSSKAAVPLPDLLWFSFLANTSLVAMNLSLMLNSVGFYQIAKLSIIPTVCVLESFLHNKRYSASIRVAVLLVMLGVAICTITDVQVRPMGLVASLVAVLTTSLQQILIGSLQKKYNIGSMDLLSKTAPLQAASLVLLGPFVDYALQRKNILEYNYTPEAAGFIAISCVLAVAVNLSQYLCIGKFSATSFQVLGHMKTVLVLLLGWLLFNSPVTLKVLGGMTIAVLGMVLYNWAESQSKRKDKVQEAAGSGSGSQAALPAGRQVQGAAVEEKAPLLSQKQDEEVTPKVAP